MEGAPDPTREAAEPRPARWPTLARVPAAALPGIPPARRRRLSTLGLHSVEDVLRHLPRRHEDRSRLWPLAQIRQPGVYTAWVTVAEVGASRPRPGLTVVRARLRDAAGGAGALGAVWFNRAYLRHTLLPGSRLLVHGPVLPDPTGRLVFRSPEVTPLPPGGPPPEPPGLVPVYPLAAGWTQQAVRSVVGSALEHYAAQIPDLVPPQVRAALGLPPAAEAWRHLHRPPSLQALETARRAAAFEELLLLQVALGLRRRARAGAVRGFRYPPPGDLTRRFLQALPFALTGAQRRVLEEIERDLAGPRPMYRLVQGDVGSGKTVVAAAAMLRAVEAGRQAVLLAPTEILARQHLWTLRRLYGGLCRTELLTGDLPRAARQRLLEDVAAGRVHVLVGTHALLQPEVRLPALGLCVTDEQHRFGVRQRDALAAKGDRPDVLVLTATPIPRTLAMTLYGDLDVSVLDELPPGRRPVRTFVRPPERREAVYGFVRAQIAAGRQAFVVCPLIAPGGGEGAEGGSAGEAELAASAERWAAWLAARLPEVRLGLVHGRMPAAAREATMARFAAGEVQCLVATTVVEVGVDVPNATVMVVEDADRFGLAQLHQLRGRVGRGPHPSYCILLARRGTERLRVLTRTADGFAIAEEDLRQRGPGELLGLRQHGLPELALALAAGDPELWRQAREWAGALLREDPDLARAAHAPLRAAAQALAGGPLG
jgi:ATP-dependent DNA helicase RecG